MFVRAPHFDTAWFVFLSFCTLGSICTLFILSICFITSLDLTPLDTAILVILIVCLCVSAVLLFSSFYLICCDLRCGKLALAIFYTTFDLFILGLAISILALEPSDLLKQIGRMWTDDQESSIVLFLEEEFDCCGFNQIPLHDCKGRTQSCFNVFEAVLSEKGVMVGGILIGIFLLFLVGVVISYIQALKRPASVAGALSDQGMNRLRERLSGETVCWF
jgi:hypothetical protein